MADREAFEAWWFNEETVEALENARSVYDQCRVAWQAAVAQTARECAEICEQEEIDGSVSREDRAYNLAIEHCAQAIRERFGIKE